MKSIKLTSARKVSKEIVTDELVNECLTAPKYEQQWFTVEHLVEFKLHLDTSIAESAWLDKSHIRDIQILTKAIQALRDYDNEKLRDILNSIDANRIHYGVVVGKIMERLNIDGENSMEEFYKYELKAYAAYQLVTSLIELNIIQLRTEFQFSVNEHTGVPEAKQVQYLSFGKAKAVNDMYVKGISLQPGTVNQKRYQVKAGGKARKLGKLEKEILSMASSFPMRLVKIELEELELYMKSSPWYLNVLKGEVANFDKLVADDLVENTLRKYHRLSSLDKMYLPMWIDYRTRMYYDLVQLGFAPHGKLFETSLWESAEPYMIEEIEEYLYSAVVLVEDRMPHHEAVAKFNANPEYYLSALRAKPEVLDTLLTTANTEKEIKAYVNAMGEHLYNRRLADAIESYYKGEPTHFLLGEDATNGGLQHGGLAFHSNNMMKGGNVGGLPTQVDSHGNLQELLGLSTRDAAKDIHQPLLHGSAMNTIAEVMKLSLRDTEALLEKAYGKEVFNIKTIADWGVAYGANFNTALMWKTRDGLFAQSIAYVEAVPLKLKALTELNTQGYSQLTIHKDMPMLRARNGENIYGSRRTQDRSLLGGSVKNRGLYANITHSIDATALRNVIRAMHAIGRGGLWKHDNFLVPGKMSVVRAAYKDSLIEEFRANHYESAMRQIIENYVGAAPELPTLDRGDAVEEMVINSHYYLAP